MRLGRRTETAAAVCLAVAAVVLALLSSNSSVTGLYHDDGIYIATARSIAEQHSYRLINLPGSPAATKYPPAYPALLAAVWAVWPQFPANLLALKALNCALLGVLVLVSLAFLRALPMLSAGDRLLALALLVTAPGIFSFADMVLSELLYTALSMGALTVFLKFHDRPRLGLVAVAAFLAALAALTRSVGLTLCCTLLMMCARHWRSHFRTMAGVMVLTYVPWLLWSTVSRAPASELLDYYVVYEASAWQLLFRNPEFALQVFRLNVPLFAGEVGRVFGLGTVPLAWLATAIAVVGVYSCRSTFVVRVTCLYVGAYLLAVVGHPYPMARYLAPLAPLFFVMLITGTRVLRPHVGPIALTFVAAILVVHFAWLGHFYDATRASVHGELGRAMPFEWAGFSETSKWIRDNTAQTAVIASGHDPFVSSSTRAAWRSVPGIHDAHFYAVGRAVGDSKANGADLLNALRALGVTHLVEDPLLLGPEGDYGRRNIRAVLASTPTRWHEVFVSADCRHRVFEFLPSPVP